MVRRAVIIGSGNVASHLAPALERAGALEVVAVYSPTPGHASDLTSKLKFAKAVVCREDVPDDADIYLLAVKDDAISELARTLRPVPGALWLHTSGGVAASVMSPLSDRVGVFYPLQTFSKGLDVDFTKLPIFIETARDDDRPMVENMARMLTPKVFWADGVTRRKLHAAAVFACNFANHMWAVADGILRREAGTDLSVLYPLLEETMRKAMSLRPSDAQTGPAVRGDHKVMEGHRALLTEDEAELYKIISQHIIKHNK